ncbi:hypothetical protein XELAEV_18035868mg [Xenopus laevis]|uniref:Receptor ligand binding region domain-containing protein n=1 Tax=Xenopus laevis TaxID=8355 RepID=A0A974HCJ2_XENLA|nr:hypothetical protein XELAEV_18035868mg [Xenopus laevis]
MLLVELLCKCHSLDWLLIFSCYIYISKGDSDCKLPSENLQLYEKDGDIIFGGLIPVYLEPSNIKPDFATKPSWGKCNKLSIFYYLHVLAMVFAINEINENPELLPNITLGFRIYDSCFNEMQAVNGALQIMSGGEKPIPNYICDMKSKVAGLVGDIQSSSSVAVARILGLYRIPQILQYVKRVKVKNTAGQELAFDENGDQIFNLEYVNWQALPNGETKYVPFATLEEFPESHIVTSDNTVFWSGDYTQVSSTYVV